MAKQSSMLTSKTAGCILGALVFGLSYTQAPLYYSNQNQYFLHGLAEAGLGDLDQDWLANTHDPTPSFSALVFFTHRFLHDGLFYGYYLAILGIYFYSLLGIFSFLVGEENSVGLPRLCFIIGFVALHAGLVRLASVLLFNVDYPWYFQAGVAGQYLLGFGLQPSVFGVLLLFSIYSFLRGRAMVAVTASSLAGVLHSTYLLGAAFLTLAYMYVSFVPRGPNAPRSPWGGTGKAACPTRALLLGAWALVLVLPVVIYNLLTFGPTSAEAFAEGQRILTHFRIPHHAEVERWFDGIALLQVVWIAAAIFLVRRSLLFPLMLCPFLLGFLLTIIQVATGSDTLALLFPWRISAVLVPLSTTVMLACVVKRLAPWLRSRTPQQQRAIRWACSAGLGLLLVGGLAVNYFGLGYRSNPDELPLLEFVRDHKQPGDVYLLPVAVPRLESAPRGARSTNFTPPPRPAKDQHLIAIDLQRFRLFTGAPIVVDFKSIPYKDVEVMAWRDRLLVCRQLYAISDWNKAEIKDTLARYKVSHVVTTARQEINCAWLEKTFDKAGYQLLRVRKTP